MKIYVDCSSRFGLNISAWALVAVDNNRKIIFTKTGTKQLTNGACENWIANYAREKYPEAEVFSDHCPNNVDKQCLEHQLAHFMAGSKMLRLLSRLQLNNN